MTSNSNVTTNATKSDEEIYMQLEDGYCIVKLNSPEALNRDSELLNHNIGERDFKAEQGDSNVKFLSLRDKEGTAHATLQVNKDVVVEMRGKDHFLPSLEYAKRISPLLNNEKLKFNVEFAKFNYVVDLDGMVHELDNLPEGLTVFGNLDLESSEIKSLPKNMKVSKSLSISDTPVETLPEGLEVGGDLFADGTRIKEIPSDLKVAGDMDFSGTYIRNIPDDFNAKGDLNIAYTGIKQLPKNLSVVGDLDISSTKITSFPECIKVEGEVCVYETDIKSFPESIAWTTAEKMPSCF